MSDYIRELRSLVGTRPLILVGAVVIIQNENQQILLQHRKDGDWGLPGGLMEPGESLEDTAMREAYEETGLRINHITMLDLFSGPDLYLKLKNGDELYSVTALYLCKDFSGQLMSDQTESHEARFFDVTDLPSLNPANNIYLKKFLNSDVFC
ncbi:NUDIX hydrolase [Paenibacillus sp. GP183]|jgi:8-oxo-dGTP pyrophosphatase MutT (NUDIX family)|uniref:NUDIX hydrolase n=1 Tax=Paenibacillus sp. GP183 TaxID=1882751 RepID=UPI00089585FA|nr:NUDIX hydrolase [Paenibacillus sp. GP183]SEC04079.1 ADP-ribose pyrophosphatase YjhB, NUDIX family [Paenibacillus sp. GP183]